MTRLERAVVMTACGWWFLVQSPADSVLRVLFPFYGIACLILSIPPLWGLVSPKKDTSD